MMSAAQATDGDQKHVILNKKYSLKGQKMIFKSGYD